MPLIWHGDDAESHRRRGFNVNSFASLLTKSTLPWETRFICYVLDNSKGCDETLDGLDTWVVWSLTEMQLGRYFGSDPFGKPLASRRDLAGKEIANGWRGILVAHRGDEKYLQKAYHVSVSWLSQQCCWNCKASRLSGSELLYTHFGPNARHRSTFLDSSDFIALCKANAWVRLPGWHIEVLMYDFLHVFDLTMVPDAAASASWTNR